MNRLATMLLAFWIAGVGCLVGCCADVANARDLTDTTQPTSNAAAASCPMHPQVSDSSANEARHQAMPSIATSSDELLTRAIPRRPEAKACCPLLGQATTEPRTIRLQSQDGAGTAQHFKADYAIQRTQANLFSRRAELVIDRGGTHLRHCVFLI